MASVAYSHADEAYGRKVHMAAKVLFIVQDEDAYRAGDKIKVFEGDKAREELRDFVQDILDGSGDDEYEGILKLNVTSTGVVTTSLITAAKEGVKFSDE